MKRLNVKQYYNITKIADAAVQGRSHIDTDTPCQDKVHHIRKNGVCVIALSDGAGSRKFSHLGAEVVTRTVCDHLSKNFDNHYDADNPSIAKALLEILLIELNDCSQENNCSINDLASTLLFVAKKRSNIIWGHIGDGVIGVQTSDKLQCLSEPENFEYANVTVFVTSPNALDHLRINKTKHFDDVGIVLMSDGSAESLYSKQKKELAPALNQMFDWLKNHSEKEASNALHENLESLIKTKTTDDCSVSLMLSIDTFFDYYRHLPRELLCELLDSKDFSYIYRAVEVLDALIDEQHQKNVFRFLSKHIPRKTKKRYLPVFKELGLVE